MRSLFYETSLGKNSDVIIDLFDVSASNNVLDNGNNSSFNRYDLVWFSSEKSVTDIINQQINFIKTPDYSNMLTWYSAGFENGPKCFVENSENIINSNKSCSLSINSPSITNFGNKFSFTFSKFYKENPQYFGYALRSCVGDVCSNWATSKVVSFELPVPTFTSETWQTISNLSKNSANWNLNHYITIFTNSISGSISWSTYTDTSLSYNFEKCDKASNSGNCEQLTTLFNQTSVTVNPASDTDYKVQVCGNKSSAPNDKICGAWSTLNIKWEFPKNVNFDISVTGTNVKTISAYSYSSSDGSFIIQWGSVPFSSLYNISWKAVPESDWTEITGLTGLFKDFNLLKGNFTYNYKVQACATIDNCSNWSQIIYVIVLLNAPIFNEAIKLQNTTTDTITGYTAFKWVTSINNGIMTKSPEVVKLDTKWGTGKGVSLKISWQSVGNATSFQVCELVNGKNSNGNTFNGVNIKNINELCTLEKDLKSYTSTSFESLKEAGSTYSYFIRSCNDANIQNNTTCSDWSAYPLTIVVPYATPNIKVDEVVCINNSGVKVICKDGDNIYVTFDNSYYVWASLTGYEYPLSYQIATISGSNIWKSVSLPIKLSNVSADFMLTTTNSNTIKYALRACNIPTEYDLSSNKEIDNRACSNFKELNVVYTKIGFDISVTGANLKWISANSYSSSDGSFIIQWGSVPFSSLYNILWSTNNSAPDSAWLSIAGLTGLFKDFNLLKGNFTYNYKVQACATIDNCSNWSQVIAVNVLYTPNTVDRDGNGLIEIYTIEDLNNIRYNLAGSSWKTSQTDTVWHTIGCPLTGCRGYELKANLDFISTKWASNCTGSCVTDGWAPIGTNLAPFTATFEGKGFEIRNLYINKPTQDYVGLFGYVSGTSMLINSVGVVNTYVKGYNYTGGLVGIQSGGTITNSYASGSVSGNNYTGGLVGIQSGGTITNSYASGSVSGNNYTGGLVGIQSGGTITNSYASGLVRGRDNTGGLVGYQNSGTSVTNSYASGSVSGNNNIGGLVGIQNSGTSVTNSYASGSVSGNNNIGGLVGIQNSGTNVTNSYASGSVSGNNNIGGLVGIQNSGTSVTNSYASGSVSGNNNIGGLVGIQNSGTSVTNSYASGSVSGNNNIGGLVGDSSGGSITNSTDLTTAQMQATSGTYPSGLGTCFQFNLNKYPKLYTWDVITSACTTTLVGGSNATR